MVRHRHCSDPAWPPLWEFQHYRLAGDLQSARQLVATLQALGILAYSGGRWQVGEDCPPFEAQHALELADLLNYVPAAGAVVTI